MRHGILKLGWCTHAAALASVKCWHYSRTLPKGKLVKIGAWENQRFKGVVIFSMGANKDLGTPYGLTKFQCCELTRIALDDHKVPVSRIISIAVKMLKKQSPGLRLVVSFADTAQGHHGGIYQASGWLYTGTTKKKTDFEVNGKKINRRTYTGILWDGKKNRQLPANAIKVESPPKHRYLFPLDRKMRKQIEPLGQPYPRAQSKEGVASGKPAGRGRFKSDLCAQKEVP